jgi:hypothetical protein
MAMKLNLTYSRLTHSFLIHLRTSPAWQPAHTTTPLERTLPWPPQLEAQRVGTQTCRASLRTRLRGSFQTKVRHASIVPPVYLD